MQDMMTEKRDPDTFREGQELFRDFEPEPPPQAWNAIRARLDEGSSGGERKFLAWLAGVGQVREFRLYPALTVISFALVALFIWIGIRPEHRIQGKAWVGQEILDRGTAFLFRVDDIHPPFDSVHFYRKTDIDSTGKFDFRSISSGSYLLRIHVHPGSAYSATYHHGYYGDLLSWDSAKLIHTRNRIDACDIRVPAITGK